jgi:hypothetical protein
MDLKIIQEILEACQNTCQLHLSYQNTNIDVLHIDSDIETEEGVFDFEPYIELLLLPGAQDDLEVGNILQIFVALPLSDVQFSEPVKVEMKNFLHLLNFRLQLGHFGYHIENDYVYFKYNMMIPLDKSEVFKEFIPRTINFIRNVLVNFGGLIQLIGSGQATTHQILTEYFDDQES